MKTFEVLFVTPHGNGWAIVNSDNVSSVRSILENQSKFQPLNILHIKEVKAICGVNTSIIYEGHCETIVSPYDLAVSQGFEGSLEDWLESLKGDDADVYAITITESYSSDTYSYDCDRTAKEIIENVVYGEKKPLFFFSDTNTYHYKSQFIVEESGQINSNSGDYGVYGATISLFTSGYTGGANAGIGTTKKLYIYADYGNNPPHNIITITQLDNSVIKPQVQSDWNQEDDTQLDFIKNKPELSTVTFRFW